jgi:hypothetical protein
MNWKAHTFKVRGELIRSKCAIESDEGYVITRYRMEDCGVYIATCPIGRIVHSGPDAERAKEACESHLAAQGVAA